jgi:hypothetical protein
MKFFRNCLLLILALSLVVSCASSPDLQRVNVSSNVSSQILNLKNSGKSNTVIADYVMKNGFLSAGEEYGYYTLTLDYKSDDRFGYYIFALLFGSFLLTIPYFLGLPIEIYDYNLTVRLDILDSNMNVIKSYSDFAKVTAGSFIYPTDHTNKVSPEYTRLIRNVQRRASADSTSINTALRAAGPIEIRQGGREAQQDDIVGALDNAARVIMASLQERNLRNVKIAIVNISTPDREQAVFIAGELEYILVQNRFTIVDRSELDRIRREQNFQLSGDVDDDQIVSIGKFAGADLVITGSITGSGSMRRLRLRVLDTQTAELRGSASEPF